MEMWMLSSILGVGYDNFADYEKNNGGLDVDFHVYDFLHRRDHNDPDPAEQNSEMMRYFLDDDAGVGEHDVPDPVDFHLAMNHVDTPFHALGNNNIDHDGLLLHCWYCLLLG